MLWAPTSAWRYLCGSWASWLLSSWRLRCWKE